MPKEKPILFSTPMVQAILTGKKTMTRRVAKGIPNNCHRIEQVNENEIEAFWGCMPGYGAFIDGAKNIKIPYQVGDILWVRETWKYYEKAVGKGESFRVKQFLAYKADGDNNDVQKSCEWYEGKWKPSIHMPRSAARIFLKVKSIRVERLQDITEEDAKVEGTQLLSHDGKSIYTKDYRSAFKVLWSNINRKRGYGWDLNPWVFVIEFERVEA